MKTLYFDRQTLKGLPHKLSNTDIAITVNDDLNIVKTIQEYDKDIQKTDKDGNLIYNQNVYQTVQKEKILGYEKTTEITETPYIENVWKTNEEGFKLYSQNVYGEDGEPTGETVEVTNFMQIFSFKDEVYYETTDKVIGQDEEGNDIYERIPHTYSVPDKYEYNTPIYVDIHMEDEEGNKLYLKAIKETWEEEEISEVIETTEPIQVFTYKEEEVTKIVSVKISDCNHVCDELCDPECIHVHDEFCEPVFEDQEVKEIMSVPDKYEENIPVMVPSYKDITVDIFSRPEEFEITELLAHQYEQELADKDYDYILADMFINEDDVDFDYEEHSANTGAFTCCIHPNGKLRLKELQLEKPARVFELLQSEIPEGIDIFINDTKFIGEKILLPKEIQSCIIRFENTTDKYLDIKSYCIAY